MKFLVIILSCAIIGVLAWGLFQFHKERIALKNEVEALKETADALKKENSYLSDRIEYFKNPENLMKELRSQVNYKKQGENMFIIIPSETTSTTP